MCGLIGAFRADKALFPLQVKQYLTQGLYVSALRGIGGTGVGIVDKDFDIDFVKSQVDAGNFIFTDKWSWVEKTAADSRAILGHTRAPTGNAGISSKNSHPFWYGEQKSHNTVLGMHNGHINNYATLTPTNFNHPVDSAHAIYSIYLNGAKATLEKITGYYVLIWYNEAEKTFNMARNTHRELYLAINKAKTHMYYASEEEILRFALDRTGIDYDKGQGFMELKPYKIYSWFLEEPTLAEPVVTEYDEKKATTAYYHGGGTTASTGTGYDKWWRTRTKSDDDKLLKEGMKFFTNVGTPSKAFQPYKINEGLNKGKDAPWGKIWGTRKMDDGLVVIEGVKKIEWETKWIHISEAIPCIVTKAEYETHGSGAAMTRYPSYKCSIDLEGANREYQDWLNGHTTVKDLEKKETLTKKSENSSESSGKSLIKAGENEVLVMVSGPDKTMIPEREWIKIAKEGCVICHGVITVKDAGKVLFYPWSRSPEDPPEDTEYQMVCPICVDNPEDVRRALGYIPV